MLPTSNAPPASQAPDHLDAAQEGKTQMAVETVNAVSDALRYVSESMSLKVTDSVYQHEQPAAESSKEAPTVDHLDAAQEGKTQMAVETVNAFSDGLRYVSEAMSLKVTDSVYEPEKPAAESCNEAPTMDHLDAAQEGRSQAVAETATYISDAVGGFLKYFSGFKGPADVAEASNWKN